MCVCVCVWGGLPQHITERIVVVSGGTTVDDFETTCWCS